MRVLTGIDIESTKRFRILFEKKPNILQKNYLKDEWDLALQKNKPWQSLAGIWCAKEAAVKCLDALEVKIGISDIVIGHNENGAPKIKLTLSEVSSKLMSLSVSISHNKEQTIAIVTALVH